MPLTMPPRREKILFVCSRNRIRSLTAERLFEGSPLYEARSAGTEAGARIRVTAGHLGWADKIFIMEKRHRDRLQEKFRDEMRGKEVICLFVPDDYTAMADDLIEILRARLAPHLSLA